MTLNVCVKGPSKQVQTVRARWGNWEDSVLFGEKDKLELNAIPLYRPEPYDVPPVCLYEDVRVFEQKAVRMDENPYHISVYTAWSITPMQVEAEDHINILPHSAADELRPKESSIPGRCLSGGA